MGLWSAGVGLVIMTLASWEQQYFRSIPDVVNMFDSCDCIRCL